MANKTIPSLPIYGSQDSDKRKKDLIEITKNDGTYATPTYGTGASRKMSVEELKTALDITSQTVNDGITDKSPSENAVFDAVYAKGLINGTIWVNAYTALGDFNLSIDKYNNVGYTDAEGPISVILPTHTASMSGKTIIVEPHRFNSGLTTVNISIPGLQVDGGGGAGTYTEVITKMGQIVTIQANYYGWHVIGHTNQVPDISFKLDLDGGNANQDIDIDGFGVNAKHFKVNGTGGAGHIGLKHQSANISASASESSIGANSVGDPVWKNDGGAIDNLELQSNKTGTVTGNEASTTKYLTVKGVYDWAVGLFAPKASPTFTGTVTTPDIVVSNATASTPAFFDAVDKLISTTAQLWGTWVQTWASKATPVDADTIGFYNSATTFVGVKSTLLNFWTTYLLPKVQALGYLSGTITANNGTVYRVPFANGANQLQDTVGFYMQPTTGGSYGLNLDKTNTFFYLRSGTNTFVYTMYVENTVVGNSNPLATFVNASGKGIVVTANQNALGTQNAMTITNKTTSNTNTEFYSTDKNTSERNLFADYCGSLWIERSGRNSSAADISTSGYSTGLSFFLKPNTTSNKDKSASILLCQYDHVNNYAAFVFKTYVSTKWGAFGENGLVVGDAFAPNASAILQADSTTKGFLPPRMTNAQRTSIASPAIGLMVYCTDATEGLWINKSTGWTFII